MNNAILMNFGDNIRIVHDYQNRPIQIDIGQAKRCTLADATIKFIRKAMPTDTLVLIPEGGKLPPQVDALMELLAGIDGREYEEVLADCNSLLGKEALRLRPTRGEIKQKLKELAFDMAQGRVVDLADALKAAAGRVTIHEEGDPRQLEKEEREQSRPTVPAAPTESIPGEHFVRPDPSLDDKLGIDDPAPASQELPVLKREASPKPIKRKTAADVKAFPTKPPRRVRLSAKAPKASDRKKAKAAGSKRIRSGEAPE